MYRVFNFDHNNLLYRPVLRNESPMEHPIPQRYLVHADNLYNEAMHQIIYGQSYTPNLIPQLNSAVDYYWLAFSLGLPEAAVKLAKCYNESLGAKMNPHLSAVLVKIYNKFQTSNNHYQIKDEQGWPLAVKVAIDLYAHNGFNYLVNKPCNTHVKELTAYEQKQAVLLCMDMVQVNPDLVASIQRDLNGNHSLSHDYTKLFALASQTEKDLKRDQPSGIKPWYCSAKEDSDEQGVATIGDITDKEDNFV